MDPTQGDEGAAAAPASVPGSQAALMGSTEDVQVRWWLEQVKDARKREKDWRRDAVKCVDLYEAVKKKEYQYNILYSNTEILAPALYNVVPRPVVVRRFRDADPLGKVSAEVVKRTLAYLADTNEFDFPDFDTIMKQGVLEALVPGRGVSRFKHEVEFYDELAEGQEPEKRVHYETVVGECIPWERFTHGYAKQWRQVPWIAFDHYMSRDELVANFGVETASKIQLTETEKESEEGAGQDKWSKKRDDERGAKLAVVHEIWNKVDKTVVFVSPGMPQGIVKKVDDPLGLSGFFPMPEPLRLFDKIKTLTPTTLYAQYEEQAMELNRLTIRINRIIGACKVRGMYDKRILGIERMLQQDDNTLLPAENMSQIGDTAGLDKAIWLMPIDKLVAVLQQLYTNRQEVKSVIYEIMGISDILRGASKASETKGAQDIKEQWGSLRISRMQRKVQKYARDCFRVMAEIAVGHLGSDTLAKITGLPIPTAQDQAKARATLQQVQQSMPPPVPGQPPQPPPPQIAQAIQQAQVTLSQPSWDDIQGLLKDCLTRSYRIDIETNSTIDPEATDDKAQIVDVMQAMAQMMAMFEPLVSSGAMPMEVVKGILQTVVRRFRFGDELEGYLDKLATPQQKPDPKVQAAQAQAQIDQQRAQHDFQLAQQKGQMDLQLAQQKIQMEQADMQRKAEFRQQEHALRMQELAMKNSMLQQEHAMRLQEVEAKTSATVETAAIKVQAAHAMPKKPASKEK